MRRFLSVIVSLALCGAALPPRAYAQAAVRVAAPRSAVPHVVVPALSFSPSWVPSAGLAPAPSFIRTLPSLPAALPQAVPMAPLAQASLHAVPAGILSGVEGPNPIAQAARPEPTSERPAESDAILSEVEGPPAAADDAAPPARQARGQEAKGRIALRFAELRAAFGSRAPEDVPASAAPKAAAPSDLLPAGVPSETDGQAAKPPEPAVPSRGRGLFGLAPVLVFFLAALAIENVGIEAQNLGMPPLIAKVFGDITISATMGMWASFADIVGSLITPPIVKKAGLKSTFLWSGGTRLALAALTAGLLAAGHITVPWLLALTALGAFVGGINYTAEKAIPAVLLGQDRAGLERFKAARQGVIEVIATLIPIAAGALVAQFGFLPAVFAFPVAGAVAMTLVALTLKMPARAAQALSALKGVSPVTGNPEGMKDFWASLTRGTRLLWSRPALRNSFLAYAAFSVLTHLFYWILAPAYGILVAGPGHEEAAALVQGVMLGLLSLGGLVASVYMMREHKRFDRLDPKDRDGAMRRSLKRWMLLGTLVLAAMVTMAVPTPAWGALTLPALALIPFGMAQVVAKLKLEALFQSASPPEALDDTTAAMEAWMSLAIMGGLWGVQWAFTSAAGYGPFAIIAWAMLPLAAIGLYLTHLLARTKKSA